jgi:hypothetical protein
LKIIPSAFSTRWPETVLARYVFTFEDPEDTNLFVRLHTDSFLYSSDVLSSYDSNVSSFPLQSRRKGPEEILLLVRAFVVEFQNRMGKGIEDLFFYF